MLLRPLFLGASGHWMFCMAFTNTWFRLVANEPTSLATCDIQLLEKLLAIYAYVVQARRKLSDVIGAGDPAPGRRDGCIRVSHQGDIEMGHVCTRGMPCVCCSRLD
jgi:hypothetical protein